ncbi:alpha/beta hydrolase family protein [Thiolinea disciformis]|uniref:alpha/beta hydrolase family protein n=1 Tax=Thiolinea disciformis TaxID=125614 RepID=UPI00036628E9|nr:alpha/beta hydrolase [Thiolinea disciformis]
MNCKTPLTTLIKIALITVCLIAPTYAADAAKPDLAAYQSFTFTAKHRSKPIEASLWYPAAAPSETLTIGENRIFYGRSAYNHAAIAQGKHPLVLISHGSGGHMAGLAWLANGLAQAGALVMLLNHQSTTTGDSSARGMILFDQRANDVKAALDHLLQDSKIAPFIDEQHISMLGFSLGGTTALTLAGVRFDRKAYHLHCKRLPKEPDCAFLNKEQVDLQQLPDSWEQDLSEHRFSQMVVIEPGMGYAALPDSLQAIKIPMLLINLGTTAQRWKTTDMAETGSNIVKLIPKAEYSVFAPAYHFTFLPECKPIGEELLREEQDDPICTDPVGTDRAHIHQQIITKVSQFLKLSKP